MIDVGMGDEEIAQFILSETGTAERRVNVATRIYQHARRPHGASRHQHGQEGDADHDPAVMDVAAGENSGERG